MNLLGRHSLNLEGAHKHQQPLHAARCFGRDITNTLIGGGQTKPIVRNKRSGSELVQKEVKSTKTQTNILVEYETQHFRILIADDHQPSYQGLLGITQKMRNILIDWLVDVHTSFGLQQPTLHLAYKYLDCYLSAKECNRAHLQLVGITCLWIASKYEEIYPPRLKVFVDVTADTYNTQQMLQMEMKIMTTLDFYLVKSTAYNFVQTLTSVGENRSMCLYAIELATLEGLSLKYKQAVIAVASISLSDGIFKTKTILKELNDLVPTCEIMDCFKELCRLMGEPNRYGLKALLRKYGQSDWHSVSKIKLALNQ